MILLSRVWIVSPAKILSSGVANFFSKQCQDCGGMQRFCSGVYRNCSGPATNNQQFLKHLLILKTGFESMLCMYIYGIGLTLHVKCKCHNEVHLHFV